MRSRVPVLVAVMQVGIVRMLVQHLWMPVPVAMRLARRRVRRVLMLVMEVMNVAMFMLERIMQMPVIVRLGEVQIDANAHQHRRAHQSKGRCLAKQRERCAQATCPGLAPLCCSAAF